MSVKETLKSWMTESEIAQADKTADLWIKGIKTLRGSISHALHNEIVKQGLSFNEAARKLGISENMLSKILYGKGNVSFETIMHVAALMGKVPYIAWKEAENVTEDDFPLSKKKKIS